MNGIINESDLFFSSEEALTIISIIRNGGGEARFVGGCVRDHLLGRPVNDVDIATTLFPEDVFNLFRRYKDIKVIPTGISHGTVTIIINKKSFEVTTLRTDLACDGRHAKVAFTSDWYLDASRRDFTFNALYADENGAIYDYFNGINHLKNGEIHFIGNPEERICEDYLRIVRAFRFHGDFCSTSMSDVIKDACFKYSACIDRLSGERIRTEFLKILGLKRSFLALKNMDLCNVLNVMIPFSLSYSFLEDEGMLIDPFLKLILICILPCNNMGIFEYMKKRFVFSRKEVGRFSAIAGLDIYRIQKLTASESGKRSLISSLGKELYNDALHMMMVAKLISHNDFLDCLRAVDKFNDIFPISGSDLQRLGYSGIELGRQIKSLRKMWEDSGCTMSKEDMISTVLSKK